MSDSIQVYTEEEAKALAAESGCECMFPEKCELFLDVDVKVRSNADRIIRRVWSAMVENGVVSSGNAQFTTSKGGNIHVYLHTTFPLDHLTRIALQAMLGSDPIKELLSLRRLEEGSTIPVLLFELPDQAKLVEEWRRECY